MALSYTLGLDIGTSGAKTVIVRHGGGCSSGVLSECTVNYKMSIPRPLWCEQQPEDWWRASCRSIKTAVTNSGLKADDISCIGITGQMHGLVLLGKKGNVLRPCIMWNDQRSAGICEKITSQIGIETITRLTGNKMLPGFTAPKIIWVRENEPKIYRQVYKILLPKDYVSYRLTGHFHTDASDASGTALFNVKDRRWSLEMLDLLDIDADLMPKEYESPEICSEVSEDGARSTGLPAGIPVIAGAGDQAAQAVGTGTIYEESCTVTIGTSGVVFSPSEKYRFDKNGRLHAFCHAVPGKWHVMGVMLNAGGSLKWYREILWASSCAGRVTAAARTDAYDLITREAARAPPGSSGLIFLPYLSGERTPYADPNARGVLFGITLAHTKSHVSRAVIEGITFGLRDCYELITDLGLKPEIIQLTGGGAKSRLWAQIIADVFHIKVSSMISTHGAAYGAALLAGAGVGLYKSVDEACTRRYTRSRVLKPTNNQKITSVYERNYILYRTLYKNLKPSFDSAARDESH